MAAGSIPTRTRSKYMSAVQQVGTVLLAPPTMPNVVDTGYVLAIAAGVRNEITSVLPESRIRLIASPPVWAFRAIVRLLAGMLDYLLFKGALNNRIGAFMGTGGCRTPRPARWRPPVLLSRAPDVDCGAGLHPAADFQAAFALKLSTKVCGAGDVPSIYCPALSSRRFRLTEIRGSRRHKLYD